MYILAIETSTRVGSIALCCDDQCVAHTTLAADLRPTQSLAPSIRSMLIDVGCQPQDLELIAATNGPGSFTGLRLAVTTAKMLAYACHAKIVAVNTLDVIAAQLPPTGASAGAVMNAQRGEWFAAHYTRIAGTVWEKTEDCRVVNRRAWLESLPAGTLLTGPTADCSSGILPNGVVLADRKHWDPVAITVGQLAWQRSRGEHYDDLWSVQPRYYRRSYAEEKRSGQAN